MKSNTLIRLQPADGKLKPTRRWKMLSKKTLFVLATLSVVIVSLLVYTTAMAAALISCDSTGKCVVRLDYYNWPDYEENIIYGFQNLGHSQNEWVIPKGRQPQSFGTQIGTMELFGYKTLMKKDGSLMKALGVCDVASIVHYVAELNGLISTTSIDDHVQLPVLPLDPHYANSIFENNFGIYTQDLGLMNEGEEDATIRWTIIAHVLTIWVDKGTEIKSYTQPVEPTATPVVPVSPVSPDKESVKESTPTETVIDGSTPYRIWFEKSQVLETAAKAGVIDKELLLSWAPRIVIGLWLFLMVFVFLLLQGWINKSGVRFVTQWIGHMYRRVEVPRGYFNKAYWSILFLYGFILRRTEDYYFQKMGWQTWWIFCCLTVFFWFAKRADKRRIARKRPRSEIKYWFMSWIVGSAVLIVAAYLWGTMVSMTFFTVVNPAAAAINTPPMPEVRKPDTFSPLPGTDWQMPLQDIPASFADKVRDLRNEVAIIAKEEGVPIEVAFALWLKESGGGDYNPENGEGLCGFYDRVKSVVDYFPPGGPLARTEVLRQLRLCMQEFKKRSNGTITFDTVDLNVLGPVYMSYNGNISCQGTAFTNWSEHPYVMNGWDAAHTSMQARSGKYDTEGKMICVNLRIIGAIPAHVRIGMILRSPVIKPTADAASTAEGMWPIEDPLRRMSNSDGMHGYPKGKDVSTDTVFKADVPVYATLSGQLTVLVDETRAKVYQPDGSALGNTWLVIYNQTSGWTATYLHLCIDPKLKEGDVVTKGQIVGKICSIGNSFGPHVHYSVFTIAGGIVDLTWIK